MNRAHYGLSPRVRGNHLWHHSGQCYWRSIPACTGEPRVPALRRRAGQVYPRVYGGTRSANRDTWPAGGLSPRVRGNLQSVRFPHAAHRSIPACTGEPLFSAGTRPYKTVYPRVYGGTVMTEDQ